MSSPLEEIRKGIENKDWELVTLGFKNLTGQDLGHKTKPKKKRGRPRKVKTKPTVEKEVKTNIFGTKMTNQFEDTQEDADRYYESADSEEIKMRDKTRIRAKRPKRTPEQKIDAICSECKKITKEYARFYDPEVYLCVKCSKV